MGLRERGLMWGSRQRMAGRGGNRLQMQGGLRGAGTQGSLLPWPCPRLPHLSGQPRVA